MADGEEFDAPGYGHGLAADAAQELGHRTLGQAQSDHHIVLHGCLLRGHEPADETSEPVPGEQFAHPAGGQLGAAGHGGGHFARLRSRRGLLTASTM